MDKSNDVLKGAPRLGATRRHPPAPRLKGGDAPITKAPLKRARREAVARVASEGPTRWMYEAAIPFNAVTYPSFQPMIEAIGQYGVGMKGPTFHEGKNGCSIMSDGWTDRKERTLVNFLVNCSKGTMFMQSIDASSMIKMGEKMFELLDKWVEQVGEENVIQVITDNHSTKEQKGKTIANTVLMPSFWNTIVFCLKVSGPLVRVLRLVDGEKKTPMGYIYEVMNRAKDAIVRSFNGNEEKYKEIFNIIDKRWEIQLHRPLHVVGYFLNPEFFYDKPKIEHDAEIMSDLYKCILRLTRDPAKQEKVVAEVSLFTNSQGLFGNELVVRTRKTRAPG
ncbi:uncharacterized protein LOC117910228 [Vitis riparia]|uniref:uncharacterized protein LOC117910228 n=1 Tax=Vitis riparia TaxID=96939 RepID=UPI00155A8873|nr:uncharacterized protein LOC117910228 [Vitis riparia]